MQNINSQLILIIVKLSSWKISSLDYNNNYDNIDINSFLVNHYKSHLFFNKKIRDLLYYI